MAKKILEHGQLQRKKWTTVKLAVHKVDFLYFPMIKKFDSKINKFLQIWVPKSKNSWIYKFSQFEKFWKLEFFILLWCIKLEFPAKFFPNLQIFCLKGFFRHTLEFEGIFWLAKSIVVERPRSILYHSMSQNRPLLTRHSTMVEKKSWPVELFHKLRMSGELLHQDQMGTPRV